MVVWLCGCVHIGFLHLGPLSKKSRRRQGKTTGQAKRFYLLYIFFFITIYILLYYTSLCHFYTILEEVITCIPCPQIANSPSGKGIREARQVKDKPRPRPSQAKCFFITFLEKLMTSQVNGQAKSTLKRLQFHESRCQTKPSMLPKHL